MIIIRIKEGEPSLFFFFSLICRGRIFIICVRYLKRIKIFCAYDVFVKASSLARTRCLINLNYKLAGKGGICWKEIAVRSRGLSVESVVSRGPTPKERNFAARSRNSVAIIPPVRCSCPCFHDVVWIRGSPFSLHAMMYGPI